MEEILSVNADRSRTNLLDEIEKAD